MADSRRKLIDAGTSATLRERTDLQVGTIVRAMIGDQFDWEWAEGEIVGWRECDGQRKPRVLFTFANGCKIEQTMSTDALRVVHRFDPSRVPADSEAQFSPTMSEAEYQAAINNDDLMRARD